MIAYSCTSHAFCSYTVSEVGFSTTGAVLSTKMPLHGDGQLHFENRECILARYVMGKNSKKTKWYAAGLCFECRQCGGCCSGPGEGYIWVTRHEIELIADFLKMPVNELRRRYLRRVGLRTSIIEHRQTRDCIFLHKSEGGKNCMIYEVRPSQCRNWPFWPENLKNPNTWNEAAEKCPGINRGKCRTLEEIERIKKNRQWWIDQKDTDESSSE